MPTLEQLSTLEHKVFGGRQGLKRELPDITDVLGEAPCFKCFESLNDFCKPEFCPKLIAWLLGRFNK